MVLFIMTLVSKSSASIFANKLFRISGLTNIIPLGDTINNESAYINIIFFNLLLILSLRESSRPSFKSNELCIPNLEDSSRSLTLPKQVE